MGLPREVFEFATESLRRMDRGDDIRALKKQELASTPKATAVQELGQEIIVIGYTGHSPILGEMYLSGTFVSGGVMNLYYKDGETGNRTNFTLVAPPVAGAGNGESFHIGFALPEVRKHRSLVNKFDVILDNRQHIAPEKVMDIDDELRQNMKDEQSTTMTRTAIRVVLRTIAAQKAKQAMKTDNVLLNLVTSIGTDVAQGQLEKADLRVGLFLPNSFYMTRIPVETGKHNVSVMALNANGSSVASYDFSNISVKQGQKVFLFVPAVR